MVFLPLKKKLKKKKKKKKKKKNQITSATTTTTKNVPKLIFISKTQYPNWYLSVENQSHLHHGNPGNPNHKLMAVKTQKPID